MTQFDAQYLVQRLHPTAHLTRFLAGWLILAGNLRLGTGATPAEAWRAAARGIGG